MNFSIINKKNITEKKYIINPYIQIYESAKNNYIIADNGYLDSHDDLYYFYNVKMIMNFGKIFSKELNVNKNKNIFIFTKKPQSSIDLNKE